MKTQEKDYAAHFASITRTFTNIGTGKKLWKCIETGKVFHGKTLGQAKAFYRNKGFQIFETA